MTKVYASGEEPRIGDVVRRVTIYSGAIQIGDVITVSNLSTGAWSGMQVINNTFHPEFFSLIARAGEQIEYLPGDVVECVKSGMVMAYRVGPGEPGDRFTFKGLVREHGDLILEGERLSASPTRFRLVHRPDAPAAVEPTLTTAQIADTLRPGDKVRFIVEGVVRPATGRVTVDEWVIRNDEIQSIEILSRAASCPPVGKLTSTDDLLPGDILVCTTRGLGLHGELVTVRSVDSASLIRTSEGLYHPSHFAFVRRPQ